MRSHDPLQRLRQLVNGSLELDDRVTTDLAKIVVGQAVELAALQARVTSLEKRLSASINREVKRPRR